MADLPILFSAPMVHAILREIKQPGTGKVQTRRVLKLPTKTASGGPIYERKDMGGWEPTTNGGGGAFTIAKDGSRVLSSETVGIWHRTTGVCIDAPIQIGDRLYVREAWRSAAPLDDTPPRDMDDLLVPPVRYEADGEVVNWKEWRGHDAGRFRQGMHMPRWASRITLTVTDVRVQQLQDISETDAIAEGCFKGKATGRVFVSAGSMRLGGDEWRNARDWYADLWDQLNHARGYGWDANPWVAAYTFRPILGNIDQVAS